MAGLEARVCEAKTGKSLSLFETCSLAAEYANNVLRRRRAAQMEVSAASITLMVLLNSLCPERHDLLWNAVHLEFISA